MGNINKNKKENHQLKDKNINEIKSLNKNKRKKENNIYEEIDELSMKKIEKTFKTFKLKVYLSDPLFIGESKVGLMKSNCFIIYDNFQFNILYEIKLGKEDKIISIVELDNKDLILLNARNRKYTDQNNILIYRLINNNYTFIQNIEIKENYSYQIQKLSNNQFIVIFRFKIEIYSLKENKLYSFDLDCRNLSSIKNIYEINEREIIITRKEREMWTCGVGEVDNLYIQKLTISKSFDKSFLKDIFKIDDFKGHYFSDYVILKNKYYLMIIDSYFFIYNFLTNTFIKECGNKSEIGGNNIIEWNCKDNNEFLLIKDHSITLFKLNEIDLNNNSSIELNIIACIKINCPYTNFKKIGNQNKFYTINIEKKFFSFNEDDKDNRFILIY